MVMDALQDQPHQSTYAAQTCFSTLPRSDGRLLAATVCTTQRDNTLRSEQKDQLMESKSNKTCKLKHKQDYGQGELAPWDTVLLAINDLKSKVGGFKKLSTDT